MEAFFYLLEIWFTMLGTAFLTIVLGAAATIGIVVLGDHYGRTPRRAWLAQQTADAAQRWARHGNPRRASHGSE